MFLAIPQTKTILKLNNCLAEAEAASGDSKLPTSWGELASLLTFVRGYGSKQHRNEITSSTHRIN